LTRKYTALSQLHRKLQNEYQRLLNENRHLKDQISNSKFTFSNIKANQITCLTGLPNLAAFEAVLTLVGSDIKPVAKLSIGDMVLLVLMKLKLNLTSKDLAMRFNIYPTQVSYILGHCLPVLAHKLKIFIKWPTAEVVQKNLPKSFRKHYKRCRVIIDCSEIFFQRPSNLDARAQTWSNYKHHNTMKFLIGITPYGAVSFISKCWGVGYPIRK
jgi:hypothetical protein